MIGRRSKSRTRQAIIDITPMIDVVFLLIIFFMTTAEFARETRAEVELPKEQGEQEDDPDEAGLIINVLLDGRIIVSQNEVTLDELENLVAGEIRKAPGGDAHLVKLLIRADENADTSVLNEIVTRLQPMGVGAARLATEVPR